MATTKGLRIGATVYFIDPESQAPAIGTVTTLSESWAQIRDHNGHPAMVDALFINECLTDKRHRDSWEALYLDLVRARGEEHAAAEAAFEKYEADLKWACVSDQELDAIREMVHDKHGIC